MLSLNHPWKKASSFFRLQMLQIQKSVKVVAETLAGLLNSVKSLKVFKDKIENWNALI